MSTEIPDVQFWECSDPTIYLQWKSENILLKPMSTNQNVAFRILTKIWKILRIAPKCIRTVSCEYAISWIYAKHCFYAKICKRFSSLTPRFWSIRITCKRWNLIGEGNFGKFQIIGHQHLTINWLMLDPQTGLVMIILAFSVYDYIYPGRKERNILFNDALNTFYLRLYGVGHMVKELSDSERGNLLPPGGLLFHISSTG